MKILHLNTYEKTGGAAIAAKRIHNGLLQKGINSIYRVAFRSTQNLSVHGPQKPKETILAILQHNINNFTARKYRSKNPKYYYSPGYFPGITANTIQSYKPDIINLHWISDCYIRIETISKIDYPIVWTIHDSWPFTGGCHVPFDCRRYMEKCEECPALDSTTHRNLSTKVLLRKKISWKHSNMTIVAPSRWLAECSKKSSLFQNNRVEVIPNGIDVSCFKPVDKKTARSVLNLPLEKTILLFGGNNATNAKNKGFHMFKDSLQKIANKLQPEKIIVAIFGEPKKPESFEAGFKIQHMGIFNDEISMALLYSAADAIIVPSIQESFGLTAAEALSCGTPVVAFDTSGLKDIVDHKQNGYLAPLYDTEEMARGISWVIENTERWEELSKNAREKVVKNFSLKKVAEKYYNLYCEILDNP